MKVVIVKRGVTPNCIETFSADGRALLYIITPSEADFPVRVQVHAQPVVEDVAPASTPRPQSRASSSTDVLNDSVLLLDAPAPAALPSHSAGPARRPLQAHGSVTKVVYVLYLSRHPQSYADAFGPDMANDTLRGIQQSLADENIYAPNGPNGTDGPKLFAQPWVAKAALDHLERQSVQLGDRSCLLSDLRMWHIIVEEDFLGDVKNVLRQLPRDRKGQPVHVSQRDTIEIPSVADFYNYPGLMEHQDSFDVVEPSSMYSRSTGQKTASTGVLHDIQPRLKRMKKGGSQQPDSQSLPSTVASDQSLSQNPSQSLSQNQSTELAEPLSLLTLTSDRLSRVQELLPEQ